MRSRRRRSGPLETQRRLVDDAGHVVGRYDGDRQIGFCRAVTDAGGAARGSAVGRPAVGRRGGASVVMH
jgi:hypothetical protein